jgi:cytochrome c-type biogenesis protein CcmH/NrfG
MAINEQLLRTLMEKNPSLSFALEESFPLKSFYAEASVLGPVMELRAGANAAPLSAETASQAVDYWRHATQSVANGADTTAASRDAYTKLILGQANLFFDRQLSSQAEQAYQLANQLSPANPEGVFSYVNLLASQNRFTEARQVVQTALQLNPDNRQFRDLLANLKPK